MICEENLYLQENYSTNLGKNYFKNLYSKFNLFENLPKYINLGSKYNHQQGGAPQHKHTTPLIPGSLL